MKKLKNTILNLKKHRADYLKKARLTEKALDVLSNGITRVGADGLFTFRAIYPSYSKETKTAAAMGTTVSEAIREASGNWRELNRTNHTFLKMPYAHIFLVYKDFQISLHPLDVARILRREHRGTHKQATISEYLTTIMFPFHAVSKVNRKGQNFEFENA